MRVRGRVVVLVVCLLSLPAITQAAIIGPATNLGEVTSIAFDFEGTLTETEEVAVLFQFSLSAPTTLSLTVEAEFDALVTLFGPIVTTDPDVAAFLDDFQRIGDSDNTDLAALTLGPGAYLFTLGQWPNFFNPNAPGGFEEVSARMYVTGQGCAQFVTLSGSCGAGGYSGTFTAQSVPEPGTLALLIVGITVAAAGRRRRQVTGKPPIGPSP